MGARFGARRVSNGPVGLAPCAGRAGRAGEARGQTERMLGEPMDVRDQVLLDQTERRVLWRCHGADGLPRSRWLRC